ncbi:hypothetical protein FCS83_07945 [Oenococcus sp. UCMA 17063]|nr:hypothetical protein [Oenococcus sp. UCMA 17063]
MSESFLCGAARLKITPPEALIPNLRGLQGLKFDGVLDDLYLRAILFKNGDYKILLLSFDLDKVPYPKENMEIISQKFQISEKNIMFLSSHVHSAPVAGFRVNEGPNDTKNQKKEVRRATKKYEEFLTQQVIKAVEIAIDKLQEAKVGYGYGKSFINMCRNQDYFPTNDSAIKFGLGADLSKQISHTLFVLKIISSTGSNIAFFINYPVHNCVMIQNKCGDKGNGLISSDIGGNSSQYLEKKFPDCVAMWTSGAAGDVNPIFCNEIFYPDPETGEQKQLFTNSKDFPLILLKTLSTRHFADILSVIRNINNYNLENDLAGYVKFIKTPGKNSDGTPSDSPYTIRVHLIKIGNLALFAFSGELYSSLGEIVEKSSKAPHTVVINHDASLMTLSGYIFDDEALKKDQSLGLPGRRETVIEQGYVKEELKRIVNELSEKAF